MKILFIEDSKRLQVAVGKGLRISGKNSNKSLTEDDLTHMFEYLWRKDPARSDGIHSGLGLALADAFARYLAIDIKAELLQSGDFCITLTIPSVFPEIK